MNYLITQNILKINWLYNKFIYTYKEYNNIIVSMVCIHRYRSIFKSKEKYIKNTLFSKFS